MILWGYTVLEIEPYLEYRVHDYKFKELVIGFFSAEGSDGKTESIEDEFCKACRAAKKNVDCIACSKEFKRVDTDTTKKKGV